MQPEFEDVVITRLGAKGDGLAETLQGLLFVPYTLPGEKVRVQPSGERGMLKDVLEASPHRIAPFCPLFTRCGGCSAQHMGEDIYRDWKIASLTTALAHAGVKAPDPAFIAAHGKGRRRVTFHARKIENDKSNEMRIGFMAAGSHHLIAIDACPVLEPELSESAPRLALNLAIMLGKTCDIQITVTQAGFDIDLRGLGEMSEKRRAELIIRADQLDLTRLSLHGDIIVERRKPVIMMGHVGMVPPPGSFLQATTEGEDQISALVIKEASKARKALDLFAGCGPFTVRLAQKTAVHAVEYEAKSLIALEKAMKTVSGYKPVTTEKRDLFRRPMLLPELKPYDLVVLDPPRAGAQAQCAILARSQVPKIVFVACDASSFARDAKTLQEGGYRLETLTLVDQFRYSAHSEMVGVFYKP
jgi:23S rRNA (uracil1939-C5)-methyltransferase